MPLSISKRKFLRCPKINKLVMHYHCERCDDNIEVDTIWDGPLDNRKLRTQVKCLYKGSIISKFAVEEGEEERLSDL